ncbi:organic cation transporter protein-like isoform X1 [Galleria mellonella]|uniref:Organic cation transporter protein-like isoform X1 n=1 Tax=Galleria mellonella TaxID=7137 RepID=A0A6J3CBF1_GALME|nr:organic cation transporter protein-like isoform X1 [Galleria mellonella]
MNENGKGQLQYFEEVKEELNKKKEDDGDILETILSHVGEMGRYQKWLFVGMMPFGLFFAYVYFVQMFIAATPQRHWCTVPELQHLHWELRRNLSVPAATAVGDPWDKCSTFNANWSQVLENMAPPALNSTVPCQYGWEFELSDIPYHTVVSERGWVCQNAGFGPIAQSVFFAGSFVGGLFFGWLADTFGRVPALVGSNIIGCVGGVASVFTTGLWDFAFCRFLVGMAYDSCFMMMYILVLEYVGPRHRTWVANMSIALFFGSGCLMLPWLALWIADWRQLVLVTSLPMLVVLAAPFLVPESARWLSSRGRINRAVDVLKRFERVNGTKIPQDVLDEFVVSSRQTRQTNESLASVFKSSPLRNAMIFMVIVYMACAVIFDGLVRMSEGLGLDFFITFTLTSATEIPSVTLLALVLDRWGRRVLTCGPMAIAGVLSLIAAFVPKGIPQVSLAIMARFCINMSYNAAIQWSTELLPTGVRASGTSLIHVSGYIATVVSPFIVYSERLWSSLPLLLLGVTALVAASIGVLLPETMGRPMPQSIADGERLVREHSLCGKPEEVDAEEWKNKENSLIT